MEISGSLVGMNQGRSDDAHSRPTNDQVTRLGSMVSGGLIPFTQ